MVFNGTWVTGPVDGHPLIGGLPNDLGLTDGPNYGLVGANDFSGINTDFFCEGHLFAVAQIGPSLSVTAYHQLSSVSCSSAINTNFGVTNFTLLPVADTQ